MVTKKDKRKRNTRQKRDIEKGKCSPFFLLLSLIECHKTLKTSVFHDVTNDVIHSGVMASNDPLASLRRALEIALQCPETTKQRVRITKAFWYALNKTPVQHTPEDANSCVVVPMEVFLVLRDSFPQSFPPGIIPLTALPLSPLDVLYPKQKKKDVFTIVSAADIGLVTDGPGAWDLSRLRAALLDHFEITDEAYVEQLSLRVKKEWDGPDMWETVSETGDLDSFGIDDCCVFQLFREANKKQKEAPQKRVEHIPTMDEVLDTANWRNVEALCDEIACSPDSFHFKEKHKDDEL